tara:strand:- start:119 stop:496 length:378 start_codon:yes stop_codon:yes gene_type:complete
MSKSTRKNPFMKKKEETPKNDRWANLEIKEETPKNKFSSNEKYEDDSFRKKNKFRSDKPKPKTSRGFRSGETFNYSLQFGDFSKSDSSFKNKKTSSFMRFTAPRPPTPPPEFNIETMSDDFPALA